MAHRATREIPAVPGFQDEVLIFELTKRKFVTYDFERQMLGATKAKTCEFASRMIENMG